MKKVGRKLDLSAVLETNDKKQQAIAAARLKNMAHTPTVAITLLYDPRFRTIDIGAIGPIPVDEADLLELLEGARQVVLLKIKEKEKANGAQGLPTPNLPGNPSPAGPGTDN